MFEQGALPEIVVLICLLCRCQSSPTKKVTPACLTVSRSSGSRSSVNTADVVISTTEVGVTRCCHPRSADHIVVTAGIEPVRKRCRVERPAVKIRRVNNGHLVRWIVVTDKEFGAVGLADCRDIAGVLKDCCLMGLRCEHWRFTSGLNYRQVGEVADATTLLTESSWKTNVPSARKSAAHTLPLLKFPTNPTDGVGDVRSNWMMCDVGLMLIAPKIFPDGSLAPTT